MQVGAVPLHVTDGAHPTLDELRKVVNIINSFVPENAPIYIMSCEEKTATDIKAMTPTGGEVLTIFKEDNVLNLIVIKK